MSVVSLPLPATVSGDLAIIRAACEKMEAGYAADACLVDGSWFVVAHHPDPEGPRAIYLFARIEDPDGKVMFVEHPYGDDSRWAFPVRDMDKAASLMSEAIFARLLGSRHRSRLGGHAPLAHHALGGVLALKRAPRLRHGHSGRLRLRRVPSARW